MKKVLPLELSDGSFVYVEVDDADDTLVEELPRGIQPASRSSKTTQKFETAMNNIKPAINALMRSLKEINEPDEICVDVGIKVSQEFGAIFASAGGDVTFKVSLKWQKAEDA